MKFQGGWVVIISSQIEPVPQQLAGAESSQAVWTAKKGKKEGLGLFAKILSGLTKNLKNGPPGTGAAAEEELSAAKGELGAEPGGKPLQKAGGKDSLRPGLLPGRETASKAKEALSQTGAQADKDSAVKKPAGKRGREGEAGEAGYLISRAELSGRETKAAKSSGEERLPAVERGNAEDRLEPEGEISLRPDTPEASGTFPGAETLSFAGFQSPAPGQGEAGEGRLGNAARDAGAEAGLEQILPTETRPGEAKKPGLSDAVSANKETGKPAESRKSERRRDRSAVFETHDLRSARESSPAAFDLKDAASPGKAPGQEIDLVVDLKNGRGNSEPAATGGEKTMTQAFDDILARELHQNLNGDIVRHASVVLRDGGEGLIRLSLKPDTLGNVKIRLEMAENKITGHIVVESDEALRAFEREIGALEQAFKDSGFDSADLNMSLASGDGGAERRQGEGEVPFFSERFAVERAASRYDALTEKTDTLFATGLANGLKPGNGRISVNLLI
jgi:hypothetical protein